MKETLKQTIETLNKELDGHSPQDILKSCIDTFGPDIPLASSLGAEDQVLTHMVSQALESPVIFILDTGRLHQATYDVMAKTSATYGFSYKVYAPDTNALQEMLAKKGPNSFYDSIENRKECCGIRKVEPLGRALAGKKAWITGLRRSQSVTRTELGIVEWDDAHSMVKINPLANWSNEDVWAYIKDNNVPYNALHDQGFPSIGCEPCTRAIEPGEDIRAGRWWWENPDSKECGLHIVDGKLVSKNANSN